MPIWLTPLFSVRRNFVFFHQHRKLFKNALAKYLFRYKNRKASGAKRNAKIKTNFRAKRTVYIELFLKFIGFQLIFRWKHFSCKTSHKPRWNGKSNWISKWISTLEESLLQANWCKQRTPNSKSHNSNTSMPQCKRILLTFCLLDSQTFQKTNAGIDRLRWNMNEIMIFQINNMSGWISLTYAIRYFTLLKEKWRNWNDGYGLNYELKKLDSHFSDIFVSSALEIFDVFILLLLWSSKVWKKGPSWKKTSPEIPTR